MGEEVPVIRRWNVAPGLPRFDTFTLLDASFQPARVGH